MAKTDKENVAKTLPAGRLTHHSMFVRDIYTPTKGAPAEPSYKIEMLWHKDADIGIIEDIILEAIEDEWGELTQEEADDILAGKSDEYSSPLKDGNKYIRKEPDKNREVYEDGKYLRAKTKFNKHGDDDAGGIMVYNEDMDELQATDQKQVYSGSYGRMAVTTNAYVDSKTDKRSISFYLSAYQRTKDGDRLAVQRDHSTLFGKVTKEGGARTRRSRSDADAD